MWRGLLLCSSHLYRQCVGRRDSFFPVENRAKGLQTGPDKSTLILVGSLLLGSSVFFNLFVWLAIAGLLSSDTARNWSVSSLFQAYWGLRSNICRHLFPRQLMLLLWINFQFFSFDFYRCSCSYIVSLYPYYDIDTLKKILKLK